MECAKVVPSGCGVRKVNKKQVKDEMERMKQAEKKKRRLEKALATSAAIRFELEKKKERQRLDEEGAVLAEAYGCGVRKVNKNQVKDEMERMKQAEQKKRCLENALATYAAIRCELEKKEQQRVDEEGAALAEASGCGVGKVNKKQAEDEMERMKQAEKKKRRLEKALATSAAIRCELIKKKEQQRLVEEGAALAEASKCGVRKVNKKQVNDEMERMKQAEKKKRRLEKALATSAAIRSELEKKKEQQRLDEEGAALAEAVALHVLLGEDSEDQDGDILKDKRIIDPWDNSGKIEVLLGGRRDKDLSKYPFEGAVAGSASGNLRYGCMWSHWGNNTNWIVSPQSLGRDSVESHNPCSNY
nr:stress response protein NST1-like [Ipomoea batatas]